jgi:hypothetical protein
MLMGGIANGGTLDALPIPLGSTLTLLMPPTLAGPGGMPLIGTFPAPASPAIRANDAAGVARRRRARATFTEVLDIENSVICQSDRSEIVRDARIEETNSVDEHSRDQLSKRWPRHAAVFDL